MANPAGSQHQILEGQESKRQKAIDKRMEQRKMLEDEAQEHQDKMAELVAETARDQTKIGEFVASCRSWFRTCSRRKCQGHSEH